MRGDAGNRDEKLGLRSMPCVGQLTIPGVADTTSNMARWECDTMSAMFKQTSRTPFL